MILLLFFMITVFWGGIDSKAANDQQIIYGEVVDLSDFEYNSEISLFSEEDHTLELNSGNHEKWIDRIDVPDYADTLYQTLVEYIVNILSFSFYTLLYYCIHYRNYHIAICNIFPIHPTKTLIPLVFHILLLIILYD